MKWSSKQSFKPDSTIVDESDCGVLPFSVKHCISQDIPDCALFIAISTFLNVCIMFVFNSTFLVKVSFEIFCIIWKEKTTNH